MIVDFHTHIYPEWLRVERVKYLESDSTFGELFSNPKAKMATAEELVEEMDAEGVDRSVVMGVGWTDHGLAREVNDYIIESVKKYPGRLIGFAGVNPAWGEVAADEVDRCAKAGLRGVGELHPDSQAFDLGDKEAMAPLIEVVRTHALLLVTHSSEPVGHAYQGKGSTYPEVLWRFIQNFPDVTVVCAHWGGGFPFYALMPEVREALSNVYFDTAASPFLYDANVFSVTISLVGADHILLGSDFPLLSAARLLEQMEESGISRSDLVAIKGGNAARLLLA